MVRVLPVSPAIMGSPPELCERNVSFFSDVSEPPAYCIRSWADMKLSATLLLLPLSVVGLWLLVPLHSLSHTPPCDQPEMQDPYVYLFLWHPLYIVGALAMGVAMFDVMVPRPPVKYLVGSVIMGTLLDTALCSFAMLRLDSRVSSERHDLRILIYAALVPSTFPVLSVYVLYAIFRVRYKQTPSTSSRRLRLLRDVEPMGIEVVPPTLNQSFQNDVKEITPGPTPTSSQGSKQNNPTPVCILPGTCSDTQLGPSPASSRNGDGCTQAIDNLRAHDAASLHTSSWSSPRITPLAVLPAAGVARTTPTPLAAIPRPTIPFAINVEAADGTPLRRKKRRTSLYSQRVDAEARRKSTRMQLSEEDRRAAIKHDILQVVITVEVTVLILVTYFSSIVFSAYFQRTTQEQFKVVLSLFFMVVQIPMAEMLMKIIIRQQATDTAKGLALHVAMKFVMDMFYFVYYRTLLITRFTLLTSLVFVELQSTVMEFVRYPFRVTRWYLRHEELLDTVLGQHRKWVVMLLSTIILVGSNTAILLGSQGSAIIGLAYVGSIVGAAGVRVGLNFSDDPPPLPDVEAAFRKRDINRMMDGTPPPRRERKLPRPHVSVEDDADMLHEAPPQSYARTLLAVNGLEHGVRSAHSSHMRSPTSVTRTTMHISPSLSDAQRDGRDRFVSNNPANDNNNKSPRGVRRALTVMDKQEAKLRDFQRLHAAEHFIRKKARELAMFGYLFYVPLLHGGYNMKFWPFASEDNFDGHSVELLWQFGLILVVLHLAEGFIARTVFNRSVGLDTFSDAVGVVRPMKVRILILISAIHILSDVYLATNKLVFCPFKLW